MSREVVLEVHVQVLSVDVGCLACTAFLPGVPTSVGGAWLTGHRGPVLFALNVSINGSPSRWVRRRRIA